MAASEGIVWFCVNLAIRNLPSSMQWTVLTYAKGMLVKQAPCEKG